MSLKYLYMLFYYFLFVLEEYAFEFEVKLSPPCKKVDFQFFFFREIVKQIILTITNYKNNNNKISK